MAEPSKDRDKAVEEARAIEVSERIADALAGRAINPDEVSLGDVMLPLLPIVRAALFNEREAEREENCKAVCFYCDEGAPLATANAHSVSGSLEYCRAGAIRSRAIRNRAARASEEPKA